MPAIVTALALTAWQSKPAETSAQAFNRWVNEDVTWIVTNEERNAFGQLQSNEERDKFIEQFRERRNPAPGAVENPFKVEHYVAIEFIDTDSNGEYHWARDPSEKDSIQRSTKL